MKKIQATQIAMGLILGAIALYTFSSCQKSGSGTPASSSNAPGSSAAANEAVAKQITTTVNEDKPDNTTGKSGTVSLSLSADNVTALNLIDAGNGITITEARLNIAAIKIKPKKDKSAEEEALDKEVSTEESTDLGEIDAASTDVFTDTEVVTETDTATTTSADATTLSLKAAQAGHGDKGVGRGTDTGTDETISVVVKFKRPFSKLRNLVKDILKGKKDEFENKEKSVLAILEKSDPSIKFAGPYIFDAVAASLTPALDTSSLPDGNYQRIEFKLRRNWTVAATDSLFGNSLYIKGTYNNGTETIPFEAETHIAMNFVIRGSGAATINANTTNQLQIVFDVAAWFDSIDLATADVDATDKVIYINHQSNRAILGQLLKNIKGKTSFGKDTNGDGKLTSSEVVGSGEEATGDAGDNFVQDTSGQ